jgi:hypothetical protein
MSSFSLINHHASMQQARTSDNLPEFYALYAEVLNQIRFNPLLLDDPEYQKITDLFIAVMTKQNSYRSIQSNSGAPSSASFQAAYTALPHTPQTRDCPERAWQQMAAQKFAAMHPMTELQNEEEKHEDDIKIGDNYYPMLDFINMLFNQEFSDESLFPLNPITNRELDQNTINQICSYYFIQDREQFLSILKMTTESDDLKKERKRMFVALVSEHLIGNLRLSQLSYGLIGKLR